VDVNRTGTGRWPRSGGLSTEWISTSRRCRPARQGHTAGAEDDHVRRPWTSQGGRRSWSAVGVQPEAARPAAVLCLPRPVAHPVPS